MSLTDCSQRHTCCLVFLAIMIFDSVYLFPLPLLPAQHSLPQVKLRVKMLSPVICPWSGICILRSWNHSLKYLISITMMLPCNIGKRFWVLLHNVAIWLNESKLLMFLQARSWKRHSPTHLFPWCPAKASQKSALQILPYWYINTVTSAKEPSSHSDAWYGNLIKSILR